MTPSCQQFNTRLAIAESEKREKRVLERKLSEMEEELKVGSSPSKSLFIYKHARTCTRICTHTHTHITDNLSPEKHNKITGDAYQLLRNIRMAFKYLDEEMNKKLITLLI